MSRDQTQTRRQPQTVHPFANGVGWRITHSSNPAVYPPGRVLRIEPDPRHEGRFSLVWRGSDERRYELCGLGLHDQGCLRGIDGTGAYRVLIEQPAGAGRIFAKISCSLGGSAPMELAGIWGAEADQPSEHVWLPALDHGTIGTIGAINHSSPKEKRP